MADATIKTTAQVWSEAEDAYITIDIDMSGWPPTTYLVQLSDPLRRFDPETGELAGEHEFIALCCKDSRPQAAYVFPSTETGGFVDPTMVPMRTRDYGLPHAVLAQLGYTLAE